MINVTERLSLLLRGLIAAAVACAAVALAPPQARAEIAAERSAGVATTSALATVIPPPPTLGDYIRKGYRQGYRRAVRHYLEQQLRSVPSARAIEWWKPSIPDWIEDAAHAVAAGYDEAKWWITNGFKCGAAVASIWVASGGKIVQVASKISRLSKADRNVRKARRAINRLGGIRDAFKVVGTYAKSRGGGVTSTEKYWIGVLVKSGGAVIANLLGVTSCFAMVEKVL